MDAQKFCLAWKDFNVVFNKEFEALRKTGDFFDVTLACEDNQLNAHKIVLSAASDFFKHILKNNKHDHPFIYLTGVKFSDLQAIIGFIYTGETEVAERDLENLLSTASKLKVKGLTESQSNPESEASSMDTLIDQSSKKKKLTEITLDKPKTFQQPNKNSDNGNQETEIMKIKSEQLENDPIIIPGYGNQETGIMEIQPEHFENDPGYGIQETGMIEIKSEHFENDPKQYTKSAPLNKMIRTSDPMDISSFLSPEEPHQPTEEVVHTYLKASAVVNELSQSQDYVSNKNELERQCSELIVSLFDSLDGKTIWQCAQCHYSSKQRYTVREHVETHISGFSHRCTLCDKSCNTRNALKVHISRKHSNKVQVIK